MTIESLRTQINNTDEKLEELLIARLGLIQAVAELKKKEHLPVLDSKREKMILKTMKSRVPVEFEPYVEMVFNALFEASKTYQTKLMAED